MPTNDREFVKSVLRSLETTGEHWAVLCRESDLDAVWDTTSDVDIVAGGNRQEIFGQLTAALPWPVRIVCAFAYDFGATGFLLVDVRDGGYMQLDVLHDPYGRNAYGVRASVVLERRLGTSPPTIAALDYVLYQICKRHVKGDSSALQHWEAQLDRWQRADVERRVEELFSRRIARGIPPRGVTAPRGRLPGMGRLRHLMRLGGRALRPVGAVVRTASTQDADELRAKLGGAFFDACSLRGGVSVNYARVLRRQLRPTLTVVVAPSGWLPLPGCIDLRGVPQDQHLEEVAFACQARIQRRFASMGRVMRKRGRTQ